MSELGDMQGQLLRWIECELRKELRNCKDGIMKAVLTKVEAECKALRAQMDFSWKASIEEEAAVRRALATHLEARISSLASGVKSLTATVQRAAITEPSQRPHPTALAALPECTEQELLARMEEALQAETAARQQLEQELRQELHEELQRGTLASDLEAAGRHLVSHVDSLTERLERLEQQQRQQQQHRQEQQKKEGDSAVHEHDRCRAAMESMLQESLSGLLELVDEKLGQRHEVPVPQQPMPGQPLLLSDGCPCPECPQIDVVAGPQAATIHWHQRTTPGGSGAMPLRSQRQLALAQAGTFPMQASPLGSSRVHDHGSLPLSGGSSVTSWAHSE